jgi:hypothetical protein
MANIQDPNIQDPIQDPRYSIQDPIQDPRQKVEKPLANGFDESRRGRE